MSRIKLLGGLRFVNTAVAWANGVPTGFEWNDPVTDNPPTFDWLDNDLDPAVADDIFELQVATTGTSFASPTTHTHTLTGAEVVAGSFDWAAGQFDALSAGSYDGRIRLIRPGTPTLVTAWVTATNNPVVVT
jgi:hypothetical protein